MKRKSFKAIAVGLVAVILIGAMSSAVYGEDKKTDAVTDEQIYATDEFRVSDIQEKENSESADVMKYARNNKNEYLIIKKESASTSAFNNSVKEIVGEKNMLTGNLLRKGIKKAEKYNKAVEKASKKSGQIVYVDKSNKELRKLMNSKKTTRKEMRKPRLMH